MKKNHFIYILSFAMAVCFCSCSGNLKSEADTMTRPQDSVSEIVIPGAAPKQVEALAERAGAATRRRTKVVIHVMEGYGNNEAFAREAAALLEDVINSDAFRDAVFANRYRHDLGLSPQQIYDKIMLAHEASGPGGEDYVVDLRLRTINPEEDGEHWMENCDPGSNAGTIGIDGGGSGVAAVCPQWLDSTAAAGKKEWLAAHFIHEYLHILGFRHPTWKSKSVPYKIHYIVETLGQNGYTIP